MSVKAGEEYRFEHEVIFDEHRLGSSAGLAVGEIEIQRGSDGLYWNGLAFVAGTQTLATTTAGGTADPHHRFDFAIPADAAEGEVFNVTMRAAVGAQGADPATEVRFALQVRELSSDPPAHQHVGEFPWDLPIGDRS